MNTNYTDSDICKWYIEGKSVPTIAKLIARSSCYIDARLKRGGVEKRPCGHPAGLPTKRKTPQAIIDRAVKMYMDGMSAKSIERSGLVSKSVVINELRARGIKIRLQRKDKSSEIVEMYQSGTSSIGIAEHLGISKKLVLRELNNAGIERRTQSRGIDDAVVRSYKNGVSAADIAAKYGVHSAHIYAILRRNCCPTKVNVRKNIELDVARVKAMYEAGNTTADIAKTFGVGKETILRRLRNIGIEIRRCVMKYPYFSPIAGELTLNGTWEVAYATVLDRLYAEGKIKKWSYEEDRIRLPNGLHYIPDFKVYDVAGVASFHEIKGRLWSKGRDKILAARSIGIGIVLLRRSVLTHIFKHHGIDVTL